VRGGLASGRTHKFRDTMAEAAQIVGKAAPDFEIEFESGEKKMLSTIIAEGKPVVLDFTANF
jgi:hypothetical protein